MRCLLVLWKQTLQYSSRRVVGVRESCTDSNQDRGCYVVGLADSGDGSQSAECEARVKGLDGLGEKIEVIDYDCEWMSVQGCGIDGLIEVFGGRTALDGLLWRRTRGLDLLLRRDGVNLHLVCHVGADGRCVVGVDGVVVVVAWLGCCPYYVVV